ncbi:hypothetical protein PhCBS80983_g01770 [Powellomyces hirtus]|uniref:UBC core domain-containing protein n=1 Tax=Powellomyces hirtus TaxID=109895 RepID=A0A507EB59_9FUNG|nr:hypothetical protein PhCBS80983_g01770 [Powellomyces hirtus]
MSTNTSPRRVLRIVATNPTVGKTVPARQKKVTPGLARLLRDLGDLQREPVPGVEVFVDEGDVRRMCVVLTPLSGHYVGIKLHLSVLIPENYPQVSPVVEISTPIPHPNIFGSYICCDILKGRIVKDSKGYIGGYTPAYALQTIFVQLLSFFTADNVEQEYSGRLERRKATDLATLQKMTSHFSCNDCGYGKKAIVSSGASASVNSSERVPSGINDSGYHTPIAAARQACALHVLDRIPDCWDLIADHLTKKDLLSLNKAYPPFSRQVDISALCLRRELRCFYLKVDFKSAILGVGVQTSRIGRNVKITSSFDLLSLDAYTQFKVSEGPWGEGISSFLPLVLNGPHFDRAQSRIEKELMSLGGRGESEPFDPRVVVEVLGKWMNRMVVDLMKDVGAEDTDANSSSSTNKKTILHASEKALTGYCTLLHLLLTLAARYPIITEFAHSKVHRFLRRESGRSKTALPDFGEFLILFALVPGVSWTDASCVLIKELLARNAYWTLTKFPHLAYMEGQVSMLRIRQTFEGGLTGLRLVLFQAYFLRKLVWRDEKQKTHDIATNDVEVNVAVEDDDEGWEKVTARRKKTDAIPSYKADWVKVHLDNLLSASAKTYGFPTAELASELASHARQILQVRSWEEVFTLLSLQDLAPTTTALSNLLKSAVNSSAAKYYHICPYSQDELWFLRYAQEPAACNPDGRPRRQRKVWMGRSFYPDPRTVIRRKADAAKEAAARLAQNTPGYCPICGGPCGV